MTITRPLIFVEDDADDQEAMKTILDEIGVETKVLFFEVTKDALEYLRTTKDNPFIIFCDVNLPGQDGFEFKKQIDNDPLLRQKSIPFIFYSTSANPDAVNHAYRTLMIQGYFEKPLEMEPSKKLISLILEYWLACEHPGK